MLSKQSKTFLYIHIIYHSPLNTLSNNICMLLLFDFFAEMLLCFAEYLKLTYILRFPKHYLVLTYNLPEIHLWILEP